ncbi:MAG: MFS transporter [Actinomycetota bacterium]
MKARRRQLRRQSWRPDVQNRFPGRPTVLATAAIFVGGVMLAAFSPSNGVLVAACVVIGLAVGSASMVVPLYIGEVAPLLGGSAAIAAIIGLLICTGSFAIGLGPVFWLLISEIYPVQIRGQAMSVATMANWGANFVVTISFLTLLSAIGNAGTFFLFGGLSILALVYFQRQVPETKNRSLEEIEWDLDLPGGTMRETRAA